MKSLSDAEARVVRALLADSPGSERARVRDAGVPRTTFQAIRQRAYVHGWLKECYLPRPDLFGVDRVRFLLVQPFSEAWDRSVRLLRAERGTVLLWATPETLLAVIFERGHEYREERLVIPSTSGRYWSVSTGPDGAGVVSYFDFEGAWSAATCGAATVRYPRGFPDLRPSARPLSERDRRAVRTLLLRPNVQYYEAPHFPRLRSSRPSHDEVRLLASGWLAHRVVPNLGEIPQHHGHRAERVVFVTGALSPHRSAREFFSSLVTCVRVHPFLFVYDGTRVLFATLSPAPASLAEGRESIADVLRQHLIKIEVVREPISSLSAVVDHRYDRLLYGPPRENVTSLG